MVIEKNGKFFIVTENKNSWTVKNKEGKVSISYKVPKDVCAGADELKDYIINHDIF